VEGNATAAVDGIELQAQLGSTDVEQLRQLVDDATRVDGTEPLGEHALLHLRHGSLPHAEHVVAREDGLLVGYAHLDPTERSSGATAEIVVSPVHRGHGIGTALVEKMLGHIAPAGLRLWAHGNSPGARRLADALGFRRVRDLWQMRLDWKREDTPDLPDEPELLEGVTVRTFRPGSDDEAWVQVNARAFAEHPEQGSLTLADLRARMAEPWFDPAGFFLAATRDEAIVGFHWTKVHGGSPDHAHEPVGEVYVLGVDPAAQGSGLGRAMTIIGLRHLRERGLEQVMLYVDGENAAAIRTYSRLGFIHESTDVMYERTPGHNVDDARTVSR
jgi:mycothiol synthase